ncbi:plasmid IncI1-type surface exclusion protein ExcA [Salmonella enterica]|nr:plasmid IncI1-type surface exclusion protein ExcA [Salmonella enterica]
MSIKYYDTYSKNWPVALTGVLSFGYLIFVLPFHFAFGFWLFSMSGNPRYGIRPQDHTMVMFIWISLAVAVVLTCYGIYKQRKNLKAFTKFFRESGLNNPMPQNIAMNRTGWGYLGLDTQNGTILYISHPETSIMNFFFPRDVRVMGFGMYDWKSVELEGNKLTIYTGNPELPTVSLTTGKAVMLYEKINAMRHQQWKYEYSVPGCVELQASKIADENGLNLVLPPQ